LLVETDENQQHREEDMPKGLIAALIVVAVIVVLAAAWIGVGTALSAGAGPVATEERPVSDFSAVELHGLGTLIITQGATPGLAVEARDNVLDRVKTTVSGGTLTLDYQAYWYAPWTFWGNNKVVYRLTVTDLTKIEAHGSADIQASQPLTADQLEVSASGSSDITLALNVRTLTIRTSGSGNVSLSGTADTLTFNSSGSSDLNSRELQSRVATIKCSGSADVEVSASEQLNVDISGSGDVSYAGNPQVKSSISGSGDIEQLR
jgi:hypothetical protein